MADEHWDILFTGPVHRCNGVPVPVSATDWNGAELSPLSKFVYRGSTWSLSARLETPATRWGLSIDELIAALEVSDALIAVSACENDGPWIPVGICDFGDQRVADRTAFDPTALPTGVAAEPAWLADCRRAAYRGSRAGRCC